MSIIDKANRILDLCNKEYPHGSSNIAPVFYQEPLDSYQTYDELLEKEKHRTVDALIDDNISETLSRNLTTLRNQIATDMSRPEYAHLPLARKRFLLRSKLAALSRRRGIGNCEEMATFCFMTWIVEYGFDRNNPEAELAYFAFNDFDETFTRQARTADHIFVIIGRKELGNNAVILDPWINKCFYLRDLSSVWRQNIFQLPVNQMRIVPKFSSKDFLSNL